MTQEFKGDIINLVSKANLISNSLAKCKSIYPNFNYTVKLKIGKNNSTLKVITR